MSAADAAANVPRVIEDHDAGRFGVAVTDGGQAVELVRLGAVVRSHASEVFPFAAAAEQLCRVLEAHPRVPLYELRPGHWPRPIGSRDDFRLRFVEQHGRLCQVWVFLVHSDLGAWADFDPRPEGNGPATARECMRASWAAGGPPDCLDAGLAAHLAIPAADAAALFGVVSAATMRPRQGTPAVEPWSDERLAARRAELDAEKVKEPMAALLREAGIEYTEANRRDVQRRIKRARQSVRASAMGGVVQHLVRDGKRRQA